MLVMLEFFGDFSIQTGSVYGVNVRIENDVVKVPDDNGEAGDRESALTHWLGDRGERTAGSHVEDPSGMRMRSSSA